MEGGGIEIGDPQEEDIVMEMNDLEKDVNN